MVTSPSLKLKIVGAARRSRLMSLLSIAALFGMMTAIYAFLSASPYAWIVWVILAVMIGYGLIVTSTLTSSLIKAHKLIKLNEWENRLALRVHKIVEQVARDAGMELSEFITYIRPDKSPNAFAAGTGKNQMVVLHTGLLHLEDKEIAGIVAHELGHLKNNDIVLLVLAQSMIMSFVLIGRLLIDLGFSVGSGSRDDKKGSLFAGFVIAFVGVTALAFGYFFAPLATLFLSRTREELADLFACGIGHGEGLAKALTSLESDEGNTQPLNSDVAQLYINRARSTSFFSDILSTHPPIPKRVQRLTQILGGDEGRVPDVLQEYLAMIGLWIMVPAMGTFGFLGKELPVPNVLGIPVAYIAAIVWLFCLNLLLGSDKTPSKLQMNGWLIGLGLLFLGGIWLSGYWAIESSRFIPVLSELAGIMIIVWALKPIVGYFGNWSGFFGILSDMATGLSMLYGIGIIVALYRM